MQQLRRFNELLERAAQLHAELERGGEQLGAQHDLAMSLVAKLTLRQCMILVRLAKGDSPKEAARNLGVGVRALEFQWAQIKLRVGISDYSSATRLALLAGLLPLRLRYS